MTQRTFSLRIVVSSLVILFGTFFIFGTFSAFAGVLDNQKGTRYPILSSNMFAMCLLARTLTLFSIITTTTPSS